MIPTVSGTNVQNQTLWDYFGLPTNVNKALKVNALPFRAYNLIFNEWFRDENLQESLKVPTGDGPDNLSDYSLVRRGKRHDYFTSCLPWPQMNRRGIQDAGDEHQARSHQSENARSPCNAYLRVHHAHRAFEFGKLGGGH